jgi:DNA adenine methylase
MQSLSLPPILLKPALKWAGGKRWLVPLLWDMWQPHSHCRLVEPFVGSMAVTLGLQPRQALLADANPHLINFYYWIRRGLVMDLPVSNDAETYYNFRQWFNQLIRQEQADSPTAAQLFYYLNRTGFNGLCRFNSRGEFNVPFGKYKVINYARDFLDYTTALTAYSFIASDFNQLMLRSSDFIYADPPYDVQFTRYSADAFRWEDQVRLAEWLSQHPGPVVASNQATPRIVELYQSLGFSLEFLSGPRRISCTGDRTPAQEILAYRGL